MKNICCRLSVLASWIIFIEASASFAQITAPIFQYVQAEYSTARQGGSFAETQISVSGLGNGNWLQFDSVSFLDGEYDSVTMYYKWDWGTSGNQMSIRLDSRTATPLVTFTNINQGVHAYGDQYQGFLKLAKAMPRASGFHTLYVTVEGPSTGWLELDKLAFTGKMTVTAQDAKTYYVSLDGSDTQNDGLSINKPFRTIQRAASVMKPGSTCEIRQGIYRETVTPLYTGLSNAPLTFEGYNNEQAFISGSEPLTGWTVHSGNIYKTKMPRSLGKFNDEIFVDGKMAWAASYPNVDAVYHPHPYMVFYGVYDWAELRKTVELISLRQMVFVGDNGSICPEFMNYGVTSPIDYAITDEFPQENPIPAGILNRPTDFLKGGIVVTHPAWCCFARITGSHTASATKTVIDAMKGGVMNRDWGTSGWIGYVFGLLDSPNEWYRDEKDSMLYIWAPGSDNPANHLVEAKRRPVGFQAQNKQYITMRNLRFHATMANFEDARNCLIEDCHFKYLSHADTIP